MYVIAQDLGGTKLSSAIFDSYGKHYFKDSIPLEGRTANKVGQLIIQKNQQLFELAANDKLSISSIGISVPGIYRKTTGTVWAPNITGWDNYPLLSELKGSVQNENIPINIESDRSCYILGETWLGEAKNCKDAIFLAVGTGIAAGIIINGNILHGSNNIAGSLGWLALDRPFLEKYKSCGFYEFHASGEGLVKVARELLTSNKEYTGILRDKNIQEVNSYNLFEAYAMRDEIAIKVLNQAIELWGMCVANLVSIFNPEKIIFGGGVFGPAIQFLNKILFEAKKWAQPLAIKQVELKASKLQGDAGLIGAAYTAVKSVKKI